MQMSEVGLPAFGWHRLTDGSQAREQQQLAFDEYESKREQVIQKEIAKIEQYVVTNLMNE